MVILTTLGTHTGNDIIQLLMMVKYISIKSIILVIIIVYCGISTGIKAIILKYLSKGNENVVT